MSAKRNQLQFFGAGGDLVDALSEFWEQEELRLVEAGRTENQPVFCANLGDLPSLGTTEAVDQASDRSYLILPKEVEPQSRPISQKSGGTKYAYDQRANPVSVVVKFGGSNNGFVIAGQIGTVSDDESSIRLYSALAKLIRRSFRKIESYYVGPAAEAMMRTGARLTYSQNAPKEYDLQLIDAG